MGIIFGCHQVVKIDFSCHLSVEMHFSWPSNDEGHFKHHLLLKINFDCQPMEGSFLVVMQMFFSCYQMIELIFDKILAKFWQNEKWILKKNNLNDCGGFQLPKVRGKISKKFPNFYNWFSICNKKYKMLIKILYFIFGLWPYLAKSS